MLWRASLELEFYGHREFSFSMTRKSCSMREMSRPIIVAEQRAARELLRRTLFPTISAAPQDQGAGLGGGVAEFS
jgi:hypothetical protein